MILGKFLNAVAVHYNRYHSDPSRAMEFLEKALAVAKFNGEANEECTALASIAQIKLDTGAYLPAQIYAHKAQKLAELSGNLYQGARALFVRAVCPMYFGNYQDSIIQLQRAREILGICGMSGGDIDYAITTIQAEVHLRKSEYAEARSIHTKIVKNSSVDVRSHIYAPLNIAIIDVIIGAAEQEVRQNLDIASSIFKYPSETIYCDMILADLQLREKDTSAASTLFQKCLRLSLEKDKQIMSYCLERLANVSQWSGTEFNWKSSWPVVYLVFSQKSKTILHFTRHCSVLEMCMYLAKMKAQHTASLLWLWKDSLLWMSIAAEHSACNVSEILQIRGEILQGPSNSGKQLAHCMNGHCKPHMSLRLTPGSLLLKRLNRKHWHTLHTPTEQLPSQLKQRGL
jgi:tetratricopeptide (TPR) repeat protein